MKPKTLVNSTNVNIYPQILVINKLLFFIQSRVLWFVMYVSLRSIVNTKRNLKASVNLGILPGDFAKCTRT